MTVKEMIKWLEEFPDQETTVNIVYHTTGSSYYDQGGNADVYPFNPEDGTHFWYTDYRGNPYVKETEPHYNTSELLLGAYNENM